MFRYRLCGLLVVFLSNLKAMDLPLHEAKKEESEIWTPGGAIKDRASKDSASRLAKLEEENKILRAEVQEKNGLMAAMRIYIARSHK